VTTPPTQVPKIVSAGIAMSPYERASDYSSTTQRRRALWVELDAPVADKRDRFFARVLRNAPDPLLSRFSVFVLDTPDPPLAIDDEALRTIVTGQSDDRAGVSAMQPLIPSDSPVHWGLPLPPGTDDTSPELFGFYKYELCVGHFDMWSTAQGRFGVPLQVSGVQHPPPQLICNVVHIAGGFAVSAPFAYPVLDSVSVQPFYPRSSMVILLYVQAEQIDGSDIRNILLQRQLANAREQDIGRTPPFAYTQFQTAAIQSLLKPLGFGPNAPLSVMAVELLPQDQQVSDPLGVNLGGQRILRTSLLTPVPEKCR